MGSFGEFLLAEPMVAMPEHDELVLTARRDAWFLRGMLAHYEQAHNWRERHGLLRGLAARVSRRFERPVSKESITLLETTFERPLLDWHGKPVGFVDIAGSYTTSWDDRFLRGTRRVRNFLVEVKPQIESFGATLRQIKAYKLHLDNELEQLQSGSERGKWLNHKDYLPIVLTRSSEFFNDFAHEGILLFTPDGPVER